MKQMLVVVDMVNGFINEGALADKKINKITPNIVNLIEKAKKEGALIVAFKDCHSVDDEEFKVFPPHCVKGSRESELIPELKKYEKDMILVEKNTTNGFITEQFMNLIKTQDFDNVLVVGCCTDICVLNAAIPLQTYLDQHDRDVKIKVYKNCVETYDAPNHNREEYNEMSYKLMSQAGIKVVESY